MKLVEILTSFGDRLGILEKAEQSASQTVIRIQTRSITLHELTAEVRAEEIKSLAESPAELAVPFDRIIETAGIKPAPHGWTLERLRQLLSTDAFKSLDRKAVQARILGILETEKVPVADLVKEAVARDQALDAFEQFARKKMKDRMTMRERRKAELESKICELQSEHTRLDEQAKADEGKWLEWRKQKRAQEHDLAWLVGFLIDQTVISTDDGD